MNVRLVEERDGDDIVRLALAYGEEAAEVLPHIVVEEEHVRRTVFRSLTTAAPTIYVCEDDGQLVGMLVASICDFHFMSGVFVQADIFYVHPQSRGSRAATLLIAEFNAWADFLKAKVAIGGNANKLNTDRTARFLERFGYEQAGLTLLRQKGA